MSVGVPISRSRFTLRFMLTCAAFFVVVYGLGTAFIWSMPPRLFPSVRFPPAFAASTLCLLWGSSSLSQAVGYVRREKQPEFRRCLCLALFAGGLFCALQMSALNWLIQRQPAAEVQTGDRAFVVVLSALHVMHFLLASMFLIFVTLKAHGDRYDHEYYWGVRMCAWFWHGLAMVWLAVLVVVAIGSLSISAVPGPQFEIAT
ncbi:hypothetical protein GC163_14545 [bacterium]|nr:hypothetical protein [bacterium]